MDLEIIYIAGASRSGSTIVEDYFARRFGGFACGEFYRLSQFAGGNARRTQEDGALNTCACRQPVLNCDFWNAVSKEAELDITNVTLRSQLSGSQRLLFRLCVTIGGGALVRWTARLYPPFQRELDVGKNCFQMYRAIARVAKTNLILDSSKQAHQYFILKAAAPKGLRLITLIRDGRAVVASMTRGVRGLEIAKQIGAKPGIVGSGLVLRAAYRGWIIWTLNALKAYVVTKRGNRVMLRYELFAADPIAEMSRVGARFLTAQIEHGEHHQSHAIGGSPSRHNGGLRGDTC